MNGIKLLQNTLSLKGQKFYLGVSLNTGVLQPGELDKWSGHVVSLLFLPHTLHYLQLVQLGTYESVRR